MRRMCLEEIMSNPDHKDLLRRIEDATEKVKISTNKVDEAALALDHLLDQMEETRNGRNGHRPA